MAKDKKSFVLYSDLIHTISQLPDDIAGKLFKHVLSYVNDDDPQTDDILVKIAFEPIKQQLKRDLIKFDKKREQWSEAGKKSAAVRATKKATNVKRNQRPLTDVKNVATDLTVSVNDNVNVINKESNIYSKTVNDCFNYLIKFFPNHLHPKNISSWLDVIDKLNRIDKIPFQLICDVVEKTRKDNFWKKNFLSLTKLRQKKDGLMYIVIFNEKVKNTQNGISNKQQERRAAINDF